MTYSLVSGPSGAALIPPPACSPGLARPRRGKTWSRWAATDAGGLVTTRSFTIDVLAAAPTLTATGPGARSPEPTRCDARADRLRGGGRGGDVVDGDLGDGTAPQTVSGANVEASHDYLVPGSDQVAAGADHRRFRRVRGGAGRGHVTAETLQATSVTTETPVSTPASAACSTRSTAALLSERGRRRAHGDRHRHERRGRSGLARDRSGWRRLPVRGGVRSPGGRHLSGRIRGALKRHARRPAGRQRRGDAGDDLTTSFSVHNDADTLSVPAFMRGPGQAVAVPASSSGLPVSFTSDGTATSVVFTVAFNPALISITGGSRLRARRSGRRLGSSQHGRLADGQTRGPRSPCTSPTAIPAGAAAVVDLVAIGARRRRPYGTTDILSSEYPSR